MNLGLARMHKTDVMGPFCIEFHHPIVLAALKRVLIKYKIIEPTT